VTFYGPFEGDGAITALGTEVRTVVAGGVWTLHNVITLNFPTAESAIVTTADPANDLLAVTVDRWGTDPFGEFEISSSYTAIEDLMHGDNRYFVPYVMYDYHDLDTTLAIQNSGEFTVSVWIYYKQEGNCEYQCSQHIEALAPGEAIRVGPGADADVGFPGCVTVGWLGSVYISAAQPLGIIVDQLSHPNPGLNRAVLSSFRGMPYKPIEFGEWGTYWYADLLYREISGWDASIQVQNLTQHSMPTFVTVDFMDQSGDEILFVGDWICRNGAETFYLPAIIDLGHNYPFGYVGAAEIASHQQVDYPGEHHDEGEPIFVVVDIKKRKMWDPLLNGGIGGWRYTVAGENQAGAYNAHPKEEKEWAWDWAMPFVAKEGNGVTTRFALRNNGNCNKFWGKIWIMDETGTAVGVIHLPWLHPKHLKIIDLAYQGWLPPGFVGAAYFEVLGIEQLCDTDNNGHVDNEPIYPSIVVLNYGWEAEIQRPQPLTAMGDLTRLYEAIPLRGGEKTCYGDIFGDVYAFDWSADTEFPQVDPEANEPIWGATVSTIIREEGPFDLDGRAYVGPDCAGAERLAGAYVELQVLEDGDWLVAGDTTTSSSGYFEFEDALELGTDQAAYRLKIFVEEGPNTVSYISPEFGDLDHVVANFHIDTVWGGGELDLNTGEWCDLQFTPPAIVDRPDQDITSASGGYELQRVEAGTWEVEADKCGYFPAYEFVDLECGADTKLDLLLVCQGILHGTVVDDATGTPLAGVQVDLTVNCMDVGRTFDLSATTGPDGVWWMLVPLCGDDTGPTQEDDGPWTLTKSKDGYSTIVRTGTEFADQFGFDSSDCVAMSSDGCDPAVLAACADPCLALIDEEVDNIDPERLVSKAYIQGRVYCDGTVSDNGVFDWGEEQPATLVRNYLDTDETLPGETFSQETWTDATGFYQFEVDVDPDGNGAVDDNNNDFTVAAQPIEMAAFDMGPDEHRVVNIDICP
jgi:hypothetical protein